MTEPEATNTDAAADTSAPARRSPPVKRANKAFTIAPQRLAGSPACLNCGTELMGPFCYYCGQPDKNLMRFFPALMRDLLEDVVDFDSRFMRTLKPLLLHPGKLTRDYLDGRRFRYVPPMRLYIFSSMVFFILAATLAGEAIDIGAGKPNGGIHIRFDSDEETVPGNLQEAIKEAELSPEEAESIAGKVEKALAAKEG